MHHHCASPGNEENLTTSDLEFWGEASSSVLQSRAIISR